MLNNLRNQLHELVIGDVVRVPALKQVVLATLDAPDSRKTAEQISSEIEEQFEMRIDMREVRLAIVDLLKEGAIGASPSGAGETTYHKRYDKLK